MIYSWGTCYPCLRRSRPEPRRPRTDACNNQNAEQNGAECDRGQSDEQARQLDTDERIRPDHRRNQGTRPARTLSCYQREFQQQTFVCDPHYPAPRLGPSLPWPVLDVGTLCPLYLTLTLPLHASANFPHCHRRRSGCQDPGTTSESGLWTLASGLFRTWTINDDERDGMRAKPRNRDRSDPDCLGRFQICDLCSFCAFYLLVCLGRRWVGGESHVTARDSGGEGGGGGAGRRRWSGQQ